MNKPEAIALFKSASAYYFEHYAADLEWAESVNPNTFKNLRSSRFLAQYCWVVYASGFKVSVVEQKFPTLRIAFKNFDLQALSRMRSTRSALVAINNQNKANGFLAGSKLIAAEGFSKYKKRLFAGGVDKLEELPGIGPITKYHLAKNIGLIDAAKPDIWLVRAADYCEAGVDELVDFLAIKFDHSRHVVDVILWRYGADIGFREIGA